MQQFHGHATLEGISQIGVIGLCVEMGGPELPVEHAGEAERGQAPPQVRVGVPPDGKFLRPDADPEQVLTADRDVPEPQSGEDLQLLGLEPSAMRFILACIESRSDRGGVASLDRHVPQYDGPRMGRMVPGVSGDHSGMGENVVVHQEHDVAGGSLDADVEGAHLALLLRQNRLHRWPPLGKLLEKLEGAVRAAVEDDDDLARRRIGDDSAHAGGEEMTTIPGRDHDGDAGQRGRRGLRLIPRPSVLARRRVGSGGSVSGSASGGGSFLGSSDSFFGSFFCSSGGGSRLRVSFVAWGAVSGRSKEIAAALDGESRCYFPPEAQRRPPAPIRYVLCAVATTGYLIQRRPRSVIVTNPPLIAGFVCLAVGRCLGAKVLVDSHPGAFGALGDTVSARLQRGHRWLLCHADGCIVAAPEWAHIVEAWGVRAIEIHEAPGATLQPVESEAGQTTPKRGRAKGPNPLTILCVGRLAPDEPTAALLEAASRFPHFRFKVTGHLSGAEPYRDRVSPNVEFVGYLRQDDYVRTMRSADAVMTLTIDPGSVMRAAYEAVYAQRPLIVSDWPIARQLFPFGICVANDADGIAEGIRHLSTHYDSFASATSKALQVQCDRWDLQLENLTEALGLDS